MQTYYTYVVDYACLRNAIYDKELNYIISNGDIITKKEFSGLGINDIKTFFVEIKIDEFKKIYLHKDFGGHFEFLNREKIVKILATYRRDQHGAITLYINPNAEFMSNIDTKISGSKIKFDQGVAVVKLDKSSKSTLLNGKYENLKTIFKDDKWSVMKYKRLNITFVANQIDMDKYETKFFGLYTYPNFLTMPSLDLLKNDLLSEKEPYFTAKVEKSKSGKPNEYNLTPYEFLLVSDVPIPNTNPEFPLYCIKYSNDDCYNITFKLQNLPEKKTDDQFIEIGSYRIFIDAKSYDALIKSNETIYFFIPIDLVKEIGEMFNYLINNIEDIKNLANVYIINEKPNTAVMIKRKEKPYEIKKDTKSSILVEIPDVIRYVKCPAGYPTVLKDLISKISEPLEKTKIALSSSSVSANVFADFDSKQTSIIRVGQCFYWGGGPFSDFFVEATQTIKLKNGTTYIFLAGDISDIFTIDMKNTVERQTKLPVEYTPYHISIYKEAKIGKTQLLLYLYDAPESIRKTIDLQLLPSWAFRATQS
jgi:hypothetical protein